MSTHFEDDSTLDKAPAHQNARSTGSQSPADVDFEEFVRANYAVVIRVIRRVGPSDVDAVDIAEEAFARAYARWDVLSVSENRRAWLLKVCSNLALSARSQGRRSYWTLRRWAQSEAALASHPAQIEDLVLNHELLRTELAALPLRQRQAITLRYVADLPLAEVAAVMGIERESAKTHINRALDKLRRRIGRDE